jgi:microcin C transport system substrate-binding protein
VISPDGLTYRFLLRPEAKFHDGTRLDAHDAAFSLNLLKSKGHPIITQQMRDVTAVEAVDDRTLVVLFAKGRGRDVPLFVAELPIFSRAYYGKREFDESTMDVPLGSGPYKVGRLETALHRITGFCDGAPPAAGRPNFDSALGVLSRSRNRVRRAQGQELSVPRGVHLAHLGHPL